MFSKDTMKISIIIPCRNERRHVREFLDSMLAQELEPGWEVEVLVADGLSDDGTREVLAGYSREDPRVRVVDNPGRIVSTGLNAAIAASTGDIVVRMDAHTVYAPDYVRQCVTVLEESGADNVGGPWVARGQGAIGKAIAAAFQSPFCTGFGKAHDPQYEGEVDTVYLGCWRRSLFGEVGMFDPGLVRNQDDEFNFRLRLAGKRVWQSPRIVSWYTPRASIRALFRQYMQYGFWKVVVIRKHRGLASWRHAVPALFVGSLLVLAPMLTLAVLLRLPAAAAALGAVLSVELGAYLLACLAATAPMLGSLGPAAGLALPLVMGVYHVAYGLGFLMGIWKLRQRSRATAPAPALFTKLTR
jgi:succinoglycan biosynthesis protein ExoA